MLRSPGGMLTLEQVVEFYNRGGDFANFNMNNLDLDITPLNLTAEEKAALVVFLKAMTDERVRYEQAPFDHPELLDRKSTRLNSSHVRISYAVFCLKKKKQQADDTSTFNHTRENTH